MDDFKKKNLIIWGVGILIVLLVVVLTVTQGDSDQPGELDHFAQCLEEQGVTFFGASWCPHCNSQKAMFGNSADLLPYIECSSGPTQGSPQTAICRQQNIQSYPTWEFADGSRQTGVVALEALAAKSGCSLEPPVDSTGASDDIPSGESTSTN